MRIVRLEWLGVLASLSLVMGCTADDGLCDAEKIEDALFQAFRGDTVRVGICRVNGSFTLPEGVTLEGSGPTASYLTSVGTDPVVIVRPSDGAEVSTVRHLTIESTGSAGLLAEGEGQVRIEDIRVRATKGIGIGIEDVNDVTINGVDLQGPVKVGNAPEIPPLVTPREIATHGLVLIDTTLADIADVDVTGFATMGVALVQTETTWAGGSSSENRGVGLIIHGGKATLSDLVLCGGLQGISITPAYGGMFVDGADVRSEGLVVCETEGIGLFHHASSSVHADLSVTDSQEAAVWGQHAGTTIELSGFEMSGNGLGGVVLYEADRLIARNGTIERTDVVSRVFYETGAIPVGDGVQVVRPQESVLLDDLALEENERVGLLLQLEGTEPAELTLSEISISGEAVEFGALAQGDDVAIAPNWDEGITRPPELEETDRVQMETGTPLNLVRNLQATDVPVAEDLAQEGLHSLLDDFE